MISRTRTLGYIEQYWPDLLEVTMRDDVWKSVHIGNADGITDAENSLTELEAHHLEFRGTAKPVEAVAKRLIEILDEGIYREVVEQIAGEGEVGKRKLAFLLYSCKDKAFGLWIRSLLGVERGLQFMTNADFSSILGARLQVNQRECRGLR